MESLYRNTPYRILSLLGMFFVILLIHAWVASAASENELVVATWGGAWTKAERTAYFEPFEKETGIKIVDVSAIGEEMWSKLRKQVETGYLEWDIISSVNPIRVLANKDILEKIDYSVITNTKDLLKESIGEYFIGGVVGGVNIAYNKNKFPGGSHPKTWSEFWEVKKFPGPRSMPNWGAPDQVLAFALIADGVSPDKVLPFDYDRAFKKLDQIKPYVTVWWTSGSQFQQILRDEEVVLAVGWDGRIIALEKQGLPIGIEWNQGYYYCSSWCVPKDVKKKNLAMKFINSTLDPQRQAVMTKELGYSPTNVKAFDYYDQQERMKRATYPPILSKMFKMDPEFLAKYQKEIQQKWEAWLLKK